MSDSNHLIQFSPRGDSDFDDELQVEEVVEQTTRREPERGPKRLGKVQKQLLTVYLTSKQQTTSSPYSIYFTLILQG